MNLPTDKLRSLAKDGAKVRVSPLDQAPAKKVSSDDLMAELIKTQQQLADALAKLAERPAQVPPDVNVEAPRVNVAAPNVTVSAPASPKKWRHKHFFDKDGNYSETISTVIE